MRNVNAGDKFIKIVHLRTTIWFTRDGTAINAFNSVFRETAYRLNLKLFDFDYEVWTILNFDKYNAQLEKEVLLRDKHHPSKQFTMYAANRIFHFQNYCLK